jgi:hypothetical protein
MQKNCGYFGLKGPLQGATDEFLGTWRAYRFNGLAFCTDIMSNLSTQRRCLKNEQINSGRHNEMHRVWSLRYSL